MKQYSEIIDRIKNSDAILIGASNGLSISEGLNLFADNEIFQSLFGDLRLKTPLTNILDGYFYNWNTPEEKWGFLSRLINYYSGSYTGSPVMNNLLEIIGNKPYFIVTSNGEGHFKLAGFDPDKVYEIEGNWIEMQCSRKCHETTYSSLERIHQMSLEEADGKVPTELLPHCPKCGAVMELYDAQPPKKNITQAWNTFLEKYHEKKLVILELGIGWRNQLIKVPLMKLTANEPNATYITINLGELYIVENIKEKSFGLDGSLDKILGELAESL